MTVSAASSGFSQKGKILVYDMVHYMLECCIFCEEIIFNYDNKHIAIACICYVWIATKCFVYIKELYKRKHRNIEPIIKAIHSCMKDSKRKQSFPNLIRKYEQPYFSNVSRMNFQSVEIDLDHLRLQCKY